MARGTVFKYGDNVDTDVIIPARYLNAPSPEELAKHCMEDIDVNYATSVKPGDIVVGGWNFGCGSSREHAPMAIQAGDTVSVDFATGTITDETQGRTWQAAPFPAFVDNIIQAGGLLNSLKARGVAK